MVVEEPLAAGRQSWAEFVAGLARQCEQGRHCFLPLQLSEDAWPLHKQLEQTNFLRAHALTIADRAPWIERRLVIELCRFTLGQGRGERVPVQVFLSHAKQDIDQEPMLFKALTAHLQATQPVEAWIDSGQIETGANFRQRIEDAVGNSAVLVLGTANYSSRPWCRREVLIAKKMGRPMVVIDGLQGLDLRSFPYLGNVPVVSWGSHAETQAVDVLLKEVLRTQYAQLLLAKQMRPDDRILTSPPELLSVIGLAPGTSILYPDPPLGDEEIEVLAPLAHRLQTPLQRAGEARALNGKTIAISISESDDIERHGLLPLHLDTVLIEVSRYLLVHGATLAYGGHLGSEGYTVALFDLVAAHQMQSTLPPVERILNYVGWPLPFATLPIQTRASFQRMATYRRTPRPAGIEELDPATFISEPIYFPADSPIRRYAWARGMTAMRVQQTAETAARIVVGGKVGPTLTALPEGGKKLSWYSGRIPGVVEEAILTLQVKSPLYLCGAFGGAAALMIDLIEGRTRNEFTWNYQKQAPHAEEMRLLYANRSVEWWDYPEMRQFVASTGIAGLSQANSLSEDENRELFRTRDLTRLVELLLLGLGRALAP
jgi:hypothetical protein